MARAASHCAAVAAGDLRICSALRTGARGLRSSWASMARNSSLRRSASLSASSARRRSSTSMLTPTMRSGRPAASRTTRPLAASHRTAPSARTTRNSSSYAPPPASAASTRATSPGRSSGWTYRLQTPRAGATAPGGRASRSNTPSDQATAPVRRFQSQAPTLAACCASRSRSSLPRRAASASRRSVTSRTALSSSRSPPTSAPRELISTGNVLPSLRRWTVSNRPPRRSDWASSSASRRAPSGVRSSAAVMRSSSSCVYP